MHNTEFSDESEKPDISSVSGVYSLSFNAEKRVLKIKNRNFLSNTGLNTRQSEPDGTCEKQEKRSFSLSIRFVAKLARACLVSDLYCLENFF